MAKGLIEKMDEKQYERLISYLDRCIEEEIVLKINSFAHANIVHYITGGLHIFINKSSKEGVYITKDEEDEPIAKELFVDGGLKEAIFDGNPDKLQTYFGRRYLFDDGEISQLEKALDQKGRKHEIYRVPDLKGAEKKPPHYYHQITPIGEVLNDVHIVLKKDENTEYCFVVGSETSQRDNTVKLLERIGKVKLSIEPEKLKNDIEDYEDEELRKSPLVQKLIELKKVCQEHGQNSLDIRKN